MATRKRSQRGHCYQGPIKVILEPVPDPDLEAIDRAYAMIFKPELGKDPKEELPKHKQSKQQRLF